MSNRLLASGNSRQIVDSAGLGAIASASNGPSAVTGRNLELQPWKEPNMKIATFAAGCFWGVEAAFRQTKGVKSTAVGYCGGATVNPTYEDVCTGRTGHAEVVQVDFDPEEITYGQLLDVYWKSHDPTQLNRQGPDTGTQYRSAIFFHSPQQQQAARASMRQLTESGKYDRPIVTEIVPAAEFFRGEEYHQQYLEKRGQASCHIPSE